MASNPPLILVSGEIRQMQIGDILTDPTGGASANGAFLGLSASSAFSKGQIGYVNGGGLGFVSVELAKADSAATCRTLLCVAAQAVIAGGTGVFFFYGYLTGLSGLSLATSYYLSATTAGAITTTPPSTAGQFIVKVGTAIIATDFFYKFERPILLS